MTTTSTTGAGLRARSPLIVVRAVSLAPSLTSRAAGDAGVAKTTLFGHFAVFNTWSRIDSFREGLFLERVKPGAFTQTFLRDRAAMRVLFQHGHDPAVGQQVIASLTTLREDAVGAFYEADLFPSVPPLVLEGLRAKAYGASFAFAVLREERVERPSPSAFNPEGLPERSIVEARVFELSPVTFPAYPTATAGVRSVSLTDDYYGALAAR